MTSSMTAATTVPVRPALHLTVQDGWMNDPLGLTHYGGQYHLFFQYVPGSTAWNPRCQWGHATSPDLFSWTEVQPALVPEPDEHGCWSGSVVTTPEGAPARLFYTSVDEENVDLGRVRVARPLDESWERWQKGEVLAAPPPSVSARVFRDPCVTRLDGEWLMVVGGGLTDGTACAFLWSSPDLETWTDRGMLATRHRDEREGAWTGGVWECPQLVALGDRHVLVVSVWDQSQIHDVVAAVGSYRDHRFVAERWQRLAAGSPYAASAFRDAQDRSGLIMWLRGVSSPGSDWVGAQSCPLLMSLVDDELRLAVHPALDRLRREADGPAPAVDVEWTPEGGEEWLEIQDADGATVARLSTADGADGPAVVLRAGSEQTHLARGSGPVRVLVDGPVFEVLTGSQFGGLPITAPPGGVRPSASESSHLRWWRLEGGGRAPNHAAGGSDRA